MVRAFIGWVFALRRRRPRTIQRDVPWRLGLRSHLLADLRLLVWSTVSVCLVACATPAARLDALAAAHGATREVLRGVGFDEVVYTRGMSGTELQLTVYFEGDGLPFVRTDLVSTDPTTHRPLALELMLAGPGAAAYVARPCYQAAGPHERCVPQLWTSARYSEVVVAAMHDVVAQLVARAPYARVTLVGYSGGGVLAMFVAEREPRVSTVVTVAANLDVAAWVGRHGYSALEGSLDPATVPQWRATLRQIHYAGGADTNVPPAIARAFAARVPGAVVAEIAAFDHRCCWVERWPALLSAAVSERARPSPQ